MEPVLGSSLEQCGYTEPPCSEWQKNNQWHTKQQPLHSSCTDRDQKMRFHITVCCRQVKTHKRLCAAECRISSLQRSIYKAFSWYYITAFSEPEILHKYWKSTEGCTVVTQTVAFHTIIKLHFLRATDIVHYWATQWGQGQYYTPVRRSSTKLRLCQWQMTTTLTETTFQRYRPWAIEKLQISFHCWRSTFICSAAFKTCHIAAMPTIHRSISLVNPITRIKCPPSRIALPPPSLIIIFDQYMNFNHHVTKLIWLCFIQLTNMAKKTALSCPYQI